MEMVYTSFLLGKLWGWDSSWALVATTIINMEIPVCNILTSVLGRLFWVTGVRFNLEGNMLNIGQKSNKEKKSWTDQRWCLVFNYLSMPPLII